MFGAFAILLKSHDPAIIYVMTKTNKAHISFLLVMALLLLSVAGVVVLYKSFASLSEAAVEQLASEALGVRVRIADLDINPDQGLVLLRGVTVANPKGYSYRPAIEIGAIDIKAHDLATRLLTFDDIRVSGMNVRIEVVAPDTNLSVLRDQARARLQQPPVDIGSIHPISVIVDHIVFSGTRVEPEVKDALANHLSPVILSEIHMHALGQDGQGVGAATALTQILAQVVNVSLRRAAQEGYLNSLSLERQQEIGARLSLKEQLVEDARAAIQRAPAEAESLKQGVKKILKVND